MEEAILSISLQETMESFDATQQKIIKLLYDGYSQMDIATMLQMSVNAVCEEIRKIQLEMTASPLMMAA